MKTKLAKVKELMSQGDELAALRIVSRFAKLPRAEKVAVQRAVATWLSPDLYLAMGYDLEVCRQQAVDAVRRLYGN
jgi:hypothetical protein